MHAIRLLCAGQVQQAPQWRQAARAARRFTSTNAGTTARYATGVSELLHIYQTIPIERTRTFSIIAHVDHGKSTLADRLLELTHNVHPLTSGQAQCLDSLEVERERGITIKAQTASMIVHHAGQPWLVNLVDTPGHVDFSYEVSRSLAACQGALLLIDCTQGIQAQTVSNFHTALEAGLTVIPVLTKIDLPSADPEPILLNIESTLGLNADSALWTSAKSGEGCGEVLPAVIEQVSSPSSVGRDAAARVLIVDSWYDAFRGVVCLVQVMDGTLRVGDAVQSGASGDRFTVQEVGLMTPAAVPVARLASGKLSKGIRLSDFALQPGMSGNAASHPHSALHHPGCLGAGQMGYIIAGMKQVSQAAVGDTLLAAGVSAEQQPHMKPLPGFKKVQPVVFASLFPVDSGDYGALKDAVERLTLNDSSVTVANEVSPSMGHGLRCGFLGRLHMDVFHQRLASEFDTEVIMTAPMVPYRLTLTSGEALTAERPTDFPPAAQVASYEEPIITARVTTPERYLSVVMGLLHERRGEQVDLTYMNVSGDAEPRVLLTYKLPWAEVVLDFFDVLKSITAGYGGFDYEQAGWAHGDIVKVDVLLNKRPVDELSFVAHRDRAEQQGRKVTANLRSLIRRQQYEIVIQAAIGAKVFSKERIPPFRKDVLSRSGKTVGGGDSTRKQKLLSKQKKGKKRMKTVANVTLPQDAFIAAMK